ncbi:restriction endonuclease subunit S, partial [Vibrio owensii]
PSVHPLKCVDEGYLHKNEKSLLKRGDFIFADTSEDFDGSGNFTYLKADAQVFAGYHTLIARLKMDLNERYLAYVLESMAFRLQVRRAVKGVKVFSITQNILKGTKVWFADEKEQELIVKYLDRKIKLLDKAISIKEKQVCLLKEQKEIVIEKAVTEGIYQNLSMRDSGIDWIGMIPEHWEVKRAKY